MAFTEDPVQGSSLAAWGTANTGAGTGSVSVSWFQARTAGNLLLLAVGCDNVVTTPTGWTLDQSAIAAAGHYLFFRIADNSATDAPAINAAARTCVAWAEYGGNDAVPSDVSTGATGGASAAAFSTGTTGTTAQNDELAVACHCSSRTGTGATWSGHTNSFVEKAETVTAASGINIGLSVSVKVLTATGTQTCSATPSASCQPHAVIGTYKASAGGAAGQPTGRRLGGVAPAAFRCGSEGVRAW